MGDTTTEQLRLQLTVDEINVLRDALNVHEEGLRATINLTSEDPALDSMDMLLDAAGTMHDDIQLIRGIREKVNREHPDGATLQ